MNSRDSRETQITGRRIRKTKKKILRVNDFNQQKYRQLIDRHKKTISELNSLRRKGVLHEYDYLFQLEDVVEISAVVARAAWIACQHIPNHQTSNANDRSNELIKKYILKAFAA